MGLRELRAALVIGGARGIGYAVSPGWIDVRQEPLASEDQAQQPGGRVGEPADVAVLVAFLLTPESGFIGQSFMVDGGMTRKMIYR